MSGVTGLAWGSPALAVAAVAAIALPVAIHLLLRRRRTPIEWAAMDLLREAVRRVERRRRLERIALLALRCLLVLCVGLAIAQPILGAMERPATAPRTLVVVLDDSIAAAELLADGRPALVWSAEAARAAIERLDPGDRAAVLLASRGGAEDPAPASADHRMALARLAGAEVSQRSADIAGALGVAARILAMEEAEGTEATVLVASALRAGTAGAFPPLPVLRSAGTRTGREPRLEWLMPPAPAGPNVQITGVSVVRAPGAVADAPRLARGVLRRDRGDGALDVRLRVAGPGVPNPVERVVRLQALEREAAFEVALPVRGGGGGESAASATGAAANTPDWAITASITADAQPEDNELSAAVGGEQRLRVGIVDRRAFATSGALDQMPSGAWIGWALAPSATPQMDVSATDPAALDARALAALDALVVAQPQLLTPAQWDLLAEFVARGGTAIFLPAQDERAQAWTTALRDRLGAPWNIGLEAQDLEPTQPLSGDHPARGMLQAIAGELPDLAPSVQVTRVLPVQTPGAGAGVQLTTVDGAPVMLAWRPRDARGQAVLLTVAMNVAWTTLPVKPLMIPLWNEIVREGARSAAEARTVRVGSEPRIERPGAVELQRIGVDGAPVPGSRAIPVAAGGRTARPLDHAGVYALRDSGGRTLGVLVAAADTSAASVRPVEMPRLEAWLGPNAVAAEGSLASGEAGGTPRGQSTSPSAGAARGEDARDASLWLLLAAGGVAVAEALLARRFSHAGVKPVRAPRGGEYRVAAGGAP